jgi:hypothetical protein
MVVVALLVASSAIAGQNPLATLPLHYKASGFEPCTGIAPVDCTGQVGAATRPTIEAQLGQPACIFLLANNTTALAGVQTAFEFGASWVLGFGLWDCQPGSVTGTAPTNPGGPTEGTIAIAFNCVTTGTLQVIGRMFFTTPPTANCISQVQSSFPFGTNVLDCQQGLDEITEPTRLGKVCVGAGGFDACDPVSAVEPATWGAIKAQYH